MPKRATINTLPAETRAWLESELARRGYGDFERLAAELHARGYQIGKSQIGRYSQQLRKDADPAKAAVAALERIAASLERIAKTCP